MNTNTVIETPLEAAYRLSMGYEEFLSYVEGNMHAEWADGEVIVFMPPKNRHQDIVRFLITLLSLFTDFFRLGNVRPAPFEMKLSPAGSAREPDILFVAQEHLDRLTEDRLVGPADLVVEVISEDSVRRDKVQKFAEYQAAGVREYWLIDSRPEKAKADFYRLDERGKFQPVPIAEDGVYRSAVIPGFSLQMQWFMAEAFPDPQMTFAQMTGFPPQVIKTLQAIAARGPVTGPATNAP